jgi:hypothetical protein
MKSTVISMLLSVLYIASVEASASSSTSKGGEKALDRGLKLMELGETETALDFFLKVIEIGNSEEKETARTCIRTLVAGKARNPSESSTSLKDPQSDAFSDGDSIISLKKLHASVAPDKDGIEKNLQEQLRTTEQKIEKAERGIRAAQNDMETSSKAMAALYKVSVQSPAHYGKQYKEAQEKNQRAQSRHSSLKRDVWCLETDLIALLEKLNLTEDPRYVAINSERAAQRQKHLERLGRADDPRYQAMRSDTEIYAADRAERDEARRLAEKIAAADAKALFNEEAKYYIVNGRCCLTAGYIPHKELEHVGIEEEKQRIAIGQHTQESQVEKNTHCRYKETLPNEFALTSGFVPDSWGELEDVRHYLDDSHINRNRRLKKLWEWCQIMGAKKNDDAKALLEHKLRRARKDAESKEEIAKKAKLMYFDALAGSTDQQGLERLKAESELAAKELEKTNDRIESLTAKLLKIT